MAPSCLTRDGLRWDPLAAAILAGLILLVAQVQDIGPGERPGDVVAVVSATAGVGSLLLWRRFPVLMVAIAAVSEAVYLARAYPGGPALLCGPLALFLLGRRGRHRLAWVGVGVMVVAVLVGQQLGGTMPLEVALISVGWNSAALLAGQEGEARARYAKERLEAVRAAAELEARIDERLQLARDLHDTVAHSMATINVQAGVAAHLLDRGDGGGAEASLRDTLEAIRVASSEAQEELTVLVRVLRRDGTGEASRQPPADLAAIGPLVESARSDGLVVELRLDDEPPPPHHQAVVGYRVVQEALANVRRHAGRGAGVRVGVGRDDDGGFAVRVDDDGGAVGSRPGDGTAPGPGFGLIGMGERVEASGGRLRAGAAASGGFSVEARWPAP